MCYFCDGALDISEALTIVERVIKIPSVDLQAVSDDKRFALVRSDLSGSFQLWSIEVGTGRMNQVSHGVQRVIFADVAPDSKTVSFTRDFGGAERHQFFLVPIDGTKREVQVSDLPDIRVYDSSWSPDGREIAFSGSTEDAQKLWVLDPRTKLHRELFSQKRSIYFPAYSHDGSTIAAWARTTDIPRSSEILMIKRRTGEATTYTPKPGSENAEAKWHPKEPRLLFVTNAKGKYDLAIYSPRDEELMYVGASSLANDFVSYGWTSDGKDVWFVAAKNGRTKLYLRKGGKTRLIRTPLGRISNAKLSSDGSFFVLSWSSLSSPPQLLKLDLRAGRTSTMYAPPVGKGLSFGRAEFLTYLSGDGLKIPAYMIFHGSREPGPVVVWAHGGPWWEVADEWNPALQAICTAGFHIFCPNIRGSTGYGSDFERMNIGDPGGMDLQDIVAGAKLIKAKGYVDSDKLGIVGASYGGFITFLAMTKVPDLWKAGAAIAGVTDRVEQYGLSDAAFRDFIVQLFGKKPEEAPALYKDRSAINFVSQMKAPILIWHRANDFRTPLGPVQKFAGQLKALGKPYEMHVVEEEGHGEQKTENLVKQYQGVVTFLLRNLA